MPAMPPALSRFPPFWDVDISLSCAWSVASNWAARGNGEQLDEAAHGLFTFGSCVLGWKNSTADGDKATGFS